MPPEMTYHGFLAPGYVFENAAEPVAMLEAHHKTVNDRELELRSSTGTTDARSFGLYGDTPGMVYGPVAREIHAFNECVDLESARRVTQTITLCMADGCGVEAIRTRTSYRLMTIDDQ